MTNQQRVMSSIKTNSLIHKTALVVVLLAVGIFASTKIFGQQGSGLLGKTGEQSNEASIKTGVETISKDECVDCVEFEIYTWDSETDENGYFMHPIQLSSIEIYNKEKTHLVAKAEGRDLKKDEHHVFMLPEGEYYGIAKAKGFITVDHEFVVSKQSKYTDFPLEKSVHLTDLKDPKPLNLKENYYVVTLFVKDDLLQPFPGVKFVFTTDKGIKKEAVSDANGTLVVSFRNDEGNAGQHLYGEYAGEYEGIFGYDNGSLDLIFSPNYGLTGQIAATSKSRSSSHSKKLFLPMKNPQPVDFSSVEKVNAFCNAFPTTTVALGQTCTCSGSCHSCSGTTINPSWADYIKRVVYKEWYASAWGSPGSGTYSYVPSSVVEAYKMAVVAVHSYTLYKYNHPSQHCSSNYWICNSTCCQAYSVPLSMPSVVTNAYNAVSDYVLTMGNGSFAKADYANRTNAGAIGCQNGQFVMSVQGAAGGCFPLWGPDPIEATFPQVAANYFGASQWGSLSYATGKVTSSSSGLPVNSSNGQSTKDCWQLLAHYYPYYHLTNCSTGIVYDLSCGTNPCSFGCGNVTTLSCSGGTATLLNQSTNTGVATTSIYGCNTGWNDWGKERVYKLVTNSTGTISASISSVSPSSADLDVFILRNPSSTSCSSLSAQTHCVGTLSSTSCTYSSAPAGTYYIVVDGANYAANSATFKLTVSAPCSSPSSKQSEDSELDEESKETSSWLSLDPENGWTATVSSGDIITITDITGKVIKTLESREDGEIWLPKLPSGMYIVTVCCDGMNKEKVGKIMCE